MFGCDNPIDYIANKLTGESEKWRELAQVQAQGAIRAIPGERYLQLIDAVNGNDPVKKEEAKEFLRRLGNLDNNAATAWTATVLCEYDPKDTLHADAFWGFSDSRAQVEYFVRNAYRDQNDVISTGYRDYTIDELNALVDAKVDTLLSEMQGTGQSIQQQPPTGGFSFPSAYLTWDNSLTPGTPFRPDIATTDNPNIVTKKTVLDRAKSARDSAAATLKELLKMQYMKKEIPAGSTTLSIPWHPEEAKSLFFILIPEEDWEKHKKDLKIRVTLHKEGDLNSTFQNLSPLKVNTNQFEGSPGREAVDVRFGGGKVRWAVVDPTHSSVSLPDLAPDKIQNMQKLLTLVKQLNDGTGTVGAPPKTRAYVVVWVMVIITLLVFILIGFLLLKFWPKLRT
jgi:hypothetical protein